MKLSNDISLEGIKDGIKVTQHDKWYIARTWQLTSEVKNITTTAVAHGFNHLWVDGHPAKKHMFSTEHTSHHISFSRDHNKPWEFLIGGEARPPHVKCLTVNKALRYALRDGSDDPLWQNFGGKRLFIEPSPESLRWLIELIKKIPREELVNNKTARALSTRQRSTTGFQTEKHLEDYIYERLIQRGLKVLRQESFETNGGIEPASRTDLIIEDNNRVFILELKLHTADVADLYQLKRYETNRALNHRSAGKQITPVLLAGHFNQSVKAEAERELKTFELISYKYKNHERISFDADSKLTTFMAYLKTSLTL